NAQRGGWRAPSGSLHPPRSSGDVSVLAEGDFSPVLRFQSRPHDVSQNLRVVPALHLLRVLQQPLLVAVVPERLSLGLLRRRGTLHPRRSVAAHRARRRGRLTADWSCGGGGFVAGGVALGHEVLEL